MNVVSFLLGDSSAPNFNVQTLQNTVSIFIGCVDKKNNWNEFARVYTASHMNVAQFILDRAVDLFDLESRNTIDTYG